MGAGRRFWVKLHPMDRHCLVAEPGHGAVIEMNMGHAASNGLKRGLVDAEPVILACNEDPIRLKVPNGLIGPSVPKRQLPSRRSE